MADAVCRIVPPFQLLKARIILCAVISAWPVCESKIRIVRVMPRDPGLSDVAAYPAYRFSKGCCVRGRFPVCLSLAQIRKSAVRICAIYVARNGAAQSVDLKNQTGNT